MDRGRSRRSRSGDRSRSRSRGRDRSRDRPPGARLADKRVYISNIPYDSRWQDIKDLFRKDVGEVAFVELFSDESEKPRGCGIIEFENAVSAKKAIEKMHRFELGGRKIVVKEDYDVERDKFGRIVTGSNSNNPGTNIRRDDSRGGGASNRDRSRDRDNRIDRNDWTDGRRGIDQQAASNAAGGNWKYGSTYGLSSTFLESLGIDGPLIPRVFISNLDFRVDEKKLKEVFRLAGRVLDVDLNKDKDGKSRGHGVIEFEHPVEAVQAISMLNNQQLFERRMHVKMDRLADPLADLAKNKLPEGLKGIGMGLGMNGQPLVDVAKSITSSTTGTSGSNIGSATTAAATLANPVSALAAMNMNQAGISNLASLMAANQSSIDMGNMPSAAAAAAAAAAANAFGVAGMGPMGALNAAAANQFANLGGGGNPGNLAAALQNSGAGLGGMQGNPVGAGGNPMSLMGSAGPNQLANQGVMGGGNIGNAAGGGSNQPSPFQTGQGSGQNQGQGGFRDMDYGYSTSVYSTPSSNYNTAYQREKQGYTNGAGGSSVQGGVGSGTSSNTVICANLPPSCTWQMLKTKFRECGDVVFAEMRDKSTGIVRFANERDAERAVKVFDKSRVDGRLVEVRFL